jgi:hypothetical protein
MRTLDEPILRRHLMRSTSCRSRWSAVVALIVLPVGAQPVLAGEEVNMSRYKATVADPPGLPGTTLVVDNAILNDLCRDDDGCSVTLRLETASVIDAYTNHLFFSESSLRWKGAPASPCANFCVDGNGFGGPLMGIGDGSNYSCIFSDGEDTGGGDLVEGWRVLALGATCVLVVVD